MNLLKKKRSVALIIWWCEGTKIRKEKRWKNSYIKAVEVTNCNPEIIKVFVNFLIEQVDVPISKIKAQVQIHEGDDINQVEGFWESETGIPRQQFNKTIVRKVGNKPGKNMGTFKVRVYGSGIFDKLSLMLKKELKGIITLDGV